MQVFAYEISTNPCSPLTKVSQTPHLRSPFGLPEGRLAPPLPPSFASELPPSLKLWRTCRTGKRGEGVFSAYPLPKGEAG